MNVEKHILEQYRTLQALVSCSSEPDRYADLMETIQRAISNASPSWEPDTWHNLENLIDLTIDDVSARNDRDELLDQLDRMTEDQRQNLWALVNMDPADRETLGEGMLEQMRSTDITLRVACPSCGAAVDHHCVRPDEDRLKGRLFSCEARIDASVEPR